MDGPNPEKSAWTEASAIDYHGLATAEPSWASNAVVYTFQGEEGDVGEPDEEIEMALFGSKTRAGDAMKALDLEVTLESAVKVQPIRSVSVLAVWRPELF